MLKLIVSKISHLLSSDGDLDAATLLQKESGRNVAPDAQPQFCDKCQAVDWDALLLAARSCDGQRLLRKSWNSPGGVPCPCCTFLARSVDDSSGYQLEIQGWDGALQAEVAGSFGPPGQIDSNGLIYSTLPFPEGTANGWRNPMARRIEPDTIDFGVLRGWIAECDQNHLVQCQPPPIIPLRLINCKTRQIESPHSYKPYCALSYVWGGTGLEDDSDCNFLTLPFDMPSTIEDAITSTLNLHVEYLWVDRYCISQQDFSEKMQEIGRMDKIYQGAHVVLIDAKGSDANHGLAGVSAARQTQSRLRVRRDELIEAPRYPEYDILRSTWASRGWTYQESAMAKRRLFFTAKQTYFECQVHSFVESVCTPTLLDEEGMSRALRKPLFAMPRPTICRHIHEYSRRKLTYPSDAIKAVLGILYHLQTSGYPSYHYWGIPVYLYQNEDSRYAFLRGLCWRPYTHMGDRKSSRRLDFPSWSWCARDLAPNGVNWSWYPDYTHTRIEMIPAVSILRDGSLVNWQSVWAEMVAGRQEPTQDQVETDVLWDTYMSSKHLHLHLRGMLVCFEAAHKENLTGLTFHCKIPHSNSKRQLNEEYTPSVFLDDKSDKSGDLQPFAAILLFCQIPNSRGVDVDEERYRYLLLRPTKDGLSPSDAGNENASIIYERVGMLELTWKPEDGFFEESEWFLHAKWDDVIIR
ncbi:hypothetical protein EG327_007971 [Venturia inaequalis]|uniref:Heterokaryon incompatibility domain-containing protein n=2 Tax=Venturia inaequalis TaxID=5025 RepID=A0A8H3UW29_VENIN|nr:hypothetical protein EG327_007971 [Venturia inaequalis]